VRVCTTRMAASSERLLGKLVLPADPGLAPDQKALQADVRSFLGGIGRAMDASGPAAIPRDEAFRASRILTEIVRGRAFANGPADLLLSTLGTVSEQVPG